MPLNYFADDSSQPKRGYQLWLILIGLAHRRETLTYGRVASLIGFGGSQALAGPLGCVMWYCQQHKLPPLTVLVVNQETGLPGDGLLSAEDLHAAREKVFNYEWFALIPPTVADLKLAQAKGKADR